MVLPKVTEAVNEWTTLRLDGGKLYTKVQTPYYLYLFTSLAAIGGFLFGYDTGVISGAIILIRKDFKLTTAWTEFVVAATIGAAAIFALVGGYLNDKIGRKPVILLASVIFSSGSFCMAFSDDKFMLVIGRMIVGTGIGLSSMTIPMYIAESAPANIRGRLVSINIVMVAAGQFIANCVAGLFSFTSDGWRYMLGLGAIPSTIQFVAFLFMPESPRWLIIQERDADAKEVLSKLRGSSADIDDEYASIRSNILTVAEEMKQRTDKPLLLQMVQTPSVLRALVLGCGIQMIQQLAGINTVMYYSATIITMAGVRSARAAIWLSALTSSVNLLFTMVGVYLVEKMGRRPLTLLSLLGAIISLAVLGAGFQMEVLKSPVIEFDETPGSNCSQYRTCGECRMDVGCGFCYTDLGSDGVANGSCLVTSPNDWQRSAEGRCDQYKLRQVEADLVWAYDFCPTQYYWLPMAGLVMYLVFFAPGMGPIPWTINAEIYPLWARGAGNGASTFCNWFFNLIISVSFLSLTETIGAHGTFWMYLGFSVVGLIFLSLTLPETKGKDLEEIEGIFAKSWLVQDLKIKPFQKKDTPFSYVHIDQSSSNLAGDVTTTESAHNDSRTSREEDSIEAMIDTKLCTNRQASTTDDGEDYPESDSDDSLT